VLIVFTFSRHCYIFFTIETQKQSAGTINTKSSCPSHTPKPSAEHLTTPRPNRPSRPTRSHHPSATQRLSSQKTTTRHCHPMTRRHQVAKAMARTPQVVPRTHRTRPAPAKPHPSSHQLHPIQVENCHIPRKRKAQYQVERASCSWRSENLLVPQLATTATCES
jgi:hypothetical protein